MRLPTSLLLLLIITLSGCTLVGTPKDPFKAIINQQNQALLQENSTLLRETLAPTLVFRKVYPSGASSEITYSADQFVASAEDGWSQSMYLRAEASGFRLVAKTATEAIVETYSLLQWRVDSSHDTFQETARAEFYFTNSYGGTWRIYKMVLYDYTLIPL